MTSGLTAERGEGMSPMRKDAILHLPMSEYCHAYTYIYSSSFACAPRAGI